MIVAPVARVLEVTDLSRAAAFYRDVLNFELTGTADGLDAATGPALLHLRREPAARSSIVFLETGDVAAARAALQARGGRPSEPVKVNWVKMEMFEIRDPDGNTIWFGQSYDAPDESRPIPMMVKTLPDLPVSDVPAAVAHYRDVLGFHVNYADPNLGVMDRDAITVLLTARTPGRKGIGATYVYVQDADRLCAELRAKGADVQGDPVSHPWGLRDFIVVDLDGNELRFGQPFE